jgi:hypothetical protein
MGVVAVFSVGGWSVMPPAGPRFSAAPALLADRCRDHGNPSDFAFSPGLASPPVDFIFLVILGIAIYH